MNKKQQVHVEVQLRDSCQVEPLEIRDRLFACLSDQCSLFKNGVIDLFGEGADQEVQALGKCIEKICVVDLPQDMVVSFWQAEMHIHVFRMSEDEPEKDFLDGEDESPAFEQWELPNKHLEGLWDSIVGT